MLCHQPDAAGRPRLGALLAAFATGLDLAQVPEPIRHKAKLHVLDSVGCGLAGASTDLSKRLLRFLEIEHASGPCPVFGADRGFGPAAAAFANAAAMNALDFDDGFEDDGRGMGHPGATLIASALSAVWGAPVDGATFLAAIIAAYEINNRLIRSMQPSIKRFRAVYGVCQHQSVGAAVAYGRLLGLDDPAAENALGLAATLANVPSLRKYNWDERPLISLKDFAAPAAEEGVRAVQLDRCGIIGSKSVFDGDTGYWRMAGSDRFDPAVLVGGLGETWSLVQNSIKPYPACRWMHTALEAFEHLRAAHALQPDEIAAVTVHTSSDMAAHLMVPEPPTMVDAQFSLPYAIAMLAHGVPCARWYDGEMIGDPRIRALSRRVGARVDAEIDRLMRDLRRPAGRVDVTARGLILESPLLPLPLGGPERPMTDEAILDKFCANTEPVLEKDGTAALRRSLMSIETADCAAAVLRLAFAARP